MKRLDREHDPVTGIALSATIGLGIGVMAGMILGELLGDVHSERVKGAVGRLRSGKPLAAEDTEDLLEEAVSLAIQEKVPGADVTVEALGNGIVELTGSAPDSAARQLAGKLAQNVPGADVVVNRILVGGRDGRDGGPRPTPTAG